MKLLLLLFHFQDKLKKTNALNEMHLFSLFSDFRNFLTTLQEKGVKYDNIIHHTFTFFFAGQPIAVQPPRPQVTHLNKKPVLQQPPTEDEIRKWTEKKRRSKSLPRGGSEIDEILGNSSF